MRRLISGAAGYCICGAERARIGHQTVTKPAGLSGHGNARSRRSRVNRSRKWPLWVHATRSPRCRCMTAICAFETSRRCRESTTYVEEGGARRKRQLPRDTEGRPRLLSESPAPGLDRWPAKDCQRRLANVRQSNRAVPTDGHNNSAPMRTSKNEKGPARRREEHRARPSPREVHRGATFRRALNMPKL
jgi:hypothetical protein